MKHNRSPKPMLVFLLVFSAFLLSCAAWGQNTQSSQEAQPGASTSPADPLKRETPHGTVTGFLRAAGQKNYELAASHLQLRHRKLSARDQTTAQEFEAILDRHYFGSLDLISRDPEGNLEDGLRPDRESIGPARIIGGHTLEIELVRLADPEAGKIWLISADTVRQIPDFYESMPFTALQNRLPEWLNRTEFFSLTALELLLFLLAIPVAWALARLLLFAAAWGLRRFTGRPPWAGWANSGDRLLNLESQQLLSHLHRLPPNPQDLRE
jgi:MscS family membrane protein